MASRDDDVGNEATLASLPLHEALRASASLDTITELLQSHPEAVRTSDENGYFPFHVALAKHADVEIIVKLLEMYPEVGEKTNYEFNCGAVLHFAIRQACSLQIIQAIIRQCPKAASTKCDDFFPLHLALTRSSTAAISSDDIILEILRAFPAATKFRDGISRLPMHLAVAGQASLEVISELFEAHREAVLEEDRNGQLPLHTAIATNASLEIVDALLSVCAATAEEYDRSGHLPFHIAVSKGVGLEVMKLLVDAFPDSISAPTKNEQRYLPLHIAILSSSTTSQEVFEWLLELYPAAAKEAVGKYRENALQMAIKHKSPLYKVNALLKAYPDAVKVMSDGKLPVVLAIMDKSPVEIIDALLQSYPEATTTMVYSLIPLCFAFEYHCTTEVIQTLLKANPSSIKKADNFKRYPLHHACTKPVPLEIFSIVYEAFPEAIEVKSAVQEMPLHTAIISGAPVENILFLVKHFPDATKVPSKDDKLPLHLAVEKQCALAVIQSLLQAFPDGARARDSNDNLPLHLALCCQASVEVVDALLEASPESAQDVDEGSGFLPLHFAVCNQASLDVVKALLRVNPGVFNVAPDNYPLHLAIMKNASDDVVLFLLETNPSAVKVWFNDESLPIHLAIQKKRSQVVLSRLLQSYPESAGKQIEDAYPWQLALQKNYGLPEIAMLLQGCPESAQEEDLKTMLRTNAKDLSANKAVLESLFETLVASDLGASKERLCSLAALVDPTLFVEAEDTRVELLTGLFKGFGYGMQTLYHAKDSVGRRVREIAKPSVRKLMDSFYLFCGRYELLDQAPLHCSATSIVLQAKDIDADTFYGQLYHQVVLPPSSSEDEMVMTWEDFRGVMLDIDKSHAAEVFRLQENAMAQYHDPISKAWIDVRIGHEDKGTGYWQIHTLDSSVQVPATASYSQLRSKKESEFVLDFMKADRDNSGGLSCEEFVDFCKSKFGEFRTVVLKLMKNEDQCQREILFRQEYELDAAYVVGNYDSPSKELLEASLARTWPGLEGYSLVEYKHCVVMPAADKSLDAICRYERPDPAQVKIYAKDIAKCMCHLHEQGLVHADLKLLNAVRLQRKILLIDLDAAVAIPPSDVEHDVEEFRGGFVGSKFSSGVLPPEMFTALNQTQREQYEEYWKDHKEKDSELWKKIKPRPSGRSDEFIVVKTFAVDAHDAPVLERHGVFLPYDLVPATRAVDYWSFGLMLFAMLTNGTSLLLLNRDDDLVDDSHMFAPSQSTDVVQNTKSKASAKAKHRSSQAAVSRYYEAMHWTSEKIAEKLRVVENPIARDLLAKLLDPNPAHRAAHFSCPAALLDHAFFAEGADASSVGLKMLADIKDLVISQQGKLDEIHSVVRRIETISTQIYQRIEKAEAVLLKGMLEAQDISVPSCIIIVNQRLEVAGTGQAEEQQVETRVEKAIGWIDKLSSLSKSLSNALTDTAGTAKKAATSAMQNLWSEQEKLYLYLVDEVTMQPVVMESSDVYPIEIDVRSPRMTALVPLMKISLKALMLVNTGAALARCLGYPLPVLSKDVVDKLHAAVGELDGKTSLTEFEMLEDMAVGATQQEDKRNDKSQSLRGKSLREFQQLLEEKDPSKSFCSLQRVMTAEGTCIWTTAANADQLEETGTILVDCCVGTDGEELSEENDLSFHHTPAALASPPTRVATTGKTGASTTPAASPASMDTMTATYNPMTVSNISTTAEQKKAADQSTPQQCDDASMPSSCSLTVHFFTQLTDAMQAKLFVLLEDGTYACKGCKKPIHLHTLGYEPPPAQKKPEIQRFDVQDNNVNQPTGRPGNCGDSCVVM